MWIEREADNLHLVALQRVVSLSSVCVPYLSLSVERTSDDLVAVWVIKRHRIDNIRVFIQG